MTTGDGTWLVSQVALNPRLSRPPHRFLRLEHYGVTVGEYTSVDALAAELAQRGLELADLEVAGRTRPMS